MIYPYLCEECGHKFEVIKFVAEIDRPEPCEKCSSPLTHRYIGRTHFFGAGDWNTQQFNPGLGCYTKSNKHAAKIAKERGLIEVGNESAEKVHKHYDDMRERDWQRGWDDTLREKVYD